MTIAVRPNKFPLTLQTSTANADGDTLTGSAVDVSKLTNLSFIL